MLCKIKNRIDQELINFSRRIVTDKRLRSAPPLLLRQVKEFILAKGKRLRPVLFVLAYMGYTKKAARGLYTSALSLELLHDFLLIHDDIIDKSDMRRGKPSMHRRLSRLLPRHRRLKFNGEDMAIVIGDVVYAISMYAFLSIKEDPIQKEKALKRFIEAAIYTGSGEVLELLSGIKRMEDMTRRDIYNIYDFKTSYYSFASPLSGGAILAGANKREAEQMVKCGISLGRAFQIKDDILGMFGEIKDTGKSPLTDLKEAKKTILIWHAYHAASSTDRRLIKRIFVKRDVKRADLLKVRKIVIKSGSLDYAEREVRRLTRKSLQIIKNSCMRTNYKNALVTYIQELLTV